MISNPLLIGCRQGKSLICEGKYHTAFLRKVVPMGQAEAAEHRASLQFGTSLIDSTQVKAGDLSWQE